MTNAWGIKLGSGGVAVEFCEQRGIVGVGWGDVDLGVVEADDEAQLRTHLASVYGPDYPSGWPGALRRFVNACRIGDFVTYYVPQRKSFVICRVIGPALKRTTDVDDDTDIWITREVETLCETGVVDFFAPLKGRVLGPRMSFWQLHGEAETLATLATGGDPLRLGAPDPVVVASLRTLRDLATTRLHALNDKDYELLAADFFRAQGAEIVGEVGADAVIDVHARFARGALGSDDWLVQVKRFQDAPVGVGLVEEFVAHAGESGRLCFVSAFGFTAEARRFADSASVYLLETSDFVPFALSGGLEARLERKVGLPGWGELRGDDSGAEPD